MACKEGLEHIEKAVRTQPGFLQLFPLALSKNTTLSKKGMVMVGTFTGDASEQEASHSLTTGVPPKFAMRASRTKGTAKSSTTSAFLGQRAAHMDGVVFHLRTNVDNSTGGICINTSGVTNGIENNTLLRLLAEQDRIIDMTR